MSNNISIQESYSSKVVNKVESVNIGGTFYTKFYTELNTNLEIGDYVYILNGNYDNTKLIEDNEYQQGSTGYKILNIDKNSLTLDIPYRDENPWNEDPFEDYSKVYLVDNLDKFNYENVDNSFGFDLFAGEKFSTLNNNIFLSQIENLPYTIETETKDKFFKSNLSDGPDLLMTETRGQLFSDSSTLNFQLEETDVYGVTNSNGITGSTALRTPIGLNFIKDFDFNSSKLVGLVSASSSSDSSIWVLDKVNLTVTNCEVKDTDNVSVVNSHIIKSFESDYDNIFPDKNNIEIELPTNTNGIYYQKRIGSGTFSITQSQGISSGYHLIGLGKSLILGYSDLLLSVNYKSYGFYSQEINQVVANIDNTYDIISTTNSVPYLSGTYTTPYFVLGSTQGGLGNYTQESYFPVGGGFVNVVPHTGLFNATGRPSKVEVNDWHNPEDLSSNLELAFLGTGEKGATNSVDLSGIYFYSYTGNYKNQSNSNNYLGNSFLFSKEIFDKYKTGIWSTVTFNPFGKFDSYELFENITDIKWLGIELNNFDNLNLSVNPSGLVVIGNQGIWYSKYLITTDSNTFHIFINMNGDLLRSNNDFNQDVISMDIPQVHIVIKSVNLTIGEFGSETLVTYNSNSNVIGSNRKYEGDTDPIILAGEYAIGSLVYSDVNQTSIDESFNYVNFDKLSVTSIDHEDSRWLLSTATSSTRFIDNGLTSSISEGVFIYDSIVGSNTTQFNINDLYVFDTGTQLPSNEVYRVRSEIFDGKRRVWAATDQGLFMFDYELDFFYQYYYSIDFDNNKIPLDETLYLNNRLYIMEKFIYDGTTFNKGDIYKWLENEKRWVIDITYMPAYLTKSHFKDGSFLPDSILNDGIFGNRDTTANWLGSGSQWRNGILYNSIWNNGTMESKSDKLSAQNYYSELDSDNNKVIFTTDFMNNSGYGYNLSIGSSILNGVIYNGHFLKCTIGEDIDESLLDQVYLGNPFNYSNIKINKGYFNENDVYSTIMDNSKIESSTLNKSNITNNSKIINTDGYDSILTDVQIENKGKIKVKGYDKWYNLRNGLTDVDIIQVHKFFIDRKDFNELEFNDWVIFNNIKLDDNNPTNILDQLFYVLGGTDGYYKDVYEDLNKINVNQNNTGYLNNNYKIFISKKTKTQNKYKSVISFNGTTLEVNKVLISDPQYSIDLSIVSNTIPHNSNSIVYKNVLKNDGVLRVSVIDTSDSTIQTNKLVNCWVNGGEMINGSIINPNQILNKFNIGTMSTIDVGGTMSILFELNDIDYEIKSSNLLGTGSIININNIWDISFTEYVGGNYKIVSTGTNSVVLSPYSTIGLTHSVILTPPISQYTSLNLNRIDGVDNDLKIKGGLFKNQSFSNTTIVNDDLDLSSDLSFDNLRKLMVINTEITSRDNNIIKSGFFGHGEITNDYGTNSSTVNLLGYKQVFNNVNINGGYITKSSFLNGTFNNGSFSGNRYKRNDDLLPINNRTYLTGNSAVIPSWINGIFNGGTINESIWINGVFNNGRFLNSEFLNGDFNGGIFGDPDSRSSLNLFRKGHWYNGTFENGIFSDNSTRVSDTNSIYGTSSYLLSSDYYIKGGTNIWEDGNFNNGLFSSIDNNVSLWKNGNFNNGQIVDSSIWYTGVFNNGKFKSTYGRYVANVWGETNLLTSASASNVSPTSSEYGSRSINLRNYYNTDLNYLTRYNIGTIRDKHGDNVFNNPGTLILDTSDNQLKYGYVSDVSTVLKDSFGNDNSSHGYGEQLINTFFDTPGSTDLHLQFKRVDYNDSNISERNPVYDSNTIGAKLRIQGGSTYIHNGSSYELDSTFLSGTISNTSLTFSSSYAWRGGIFNGGEFGNRFNEFNANPSWENGTFNGGKFYGKIWKTGTLIKGDFNGSGLTQSQTDLNNIFEGYDPQSTMEQYIDDFSNITIGTVSPLQDNYKNILDNYKWFGIFLSGKVSPNINEFNISERVYENTLVESFKKEKYKRRENKQVNFNRSLWVSGEFNNVDGNFNESIWLSGTFSNGQFNNSMFNPYVQRWDFETTDLSDIKFTFELDTDKSVWNNGTFNSGVFYYSDWNNGTFENGSMVGGLYKKGISNYMSSFSTIWESGRHRNGNWYGSNFTIDNVYNTNGVPNPFEYLGQYFSGTEFAPFITDILSNNAMRLQDDRLHIWNTIEGTQSIVSYDLSSHDLQQSSIQIPGNYSASIADNSTPLDSTLGIFKLDLNATFHYAPPYITSYSLNLSDNIKIESGAYRISFYTSNIDKTWGISAPLSTGYFGLSFQLRADIFTNGNLVQSDVLLKNVSNVPSSNVEYLFSIPTDDEYRLRITVSADFANNVSDTIYMEIDEAINDINYTSDNNTLNGHIQANFSGNYLDSDMVISTQSIDYKNDIGVTTSIVYEQNDILSISVPTIFKTSNGAFTQYGNGSFNEGIWENGVWNNGYRGIELGTYIDADGNGIFTYTDGSTATVSMNSLYTNIPKYKYRTSPIIYFNKVQRSFKTTKDTWRFILESSLNIDGDNSSETYNKLNPGDQVTIGNIISIDINGNRKLMKNVFVVIDVPTPNRITLEYTESFPIDNIEIDSDRHLIYVTKNVWVNGAYLNGHFEGVMTNGYIRGNRELTKIEDSTLIDVTFKGGHLVGTKYGLTHSFDNTSNVANTLSPQFEQKYGNLYHSTVVQNMNFDDDVTLTTFDMVSPRNLVITGSASTGEKEITFGSTSSSTTKAVQYIYNSDIDVVYEPDTFSSLFNQNIFNSHVINQGKIGSFTETKLYNIPAGYISYDILSSNSKFSYSLKPNHKEDIQVYNLNLGSKYKKYNSISDYDFSKSPNNDLNIDIPSTYNIIESGTYGIYVKNIGSDGISYTNSISQDIHEEYMYTWATNSNLISGDNLFKTRGRYHIIEVDVEFKNGDTTINPYTLTNNVTLTTSFTYSNSSIPLLSIGQSYNELYETTSTTGYLSSYSNNIIKFVTGDRESEINNFGNDLIDENRITFKTYIYNNFGGYRDSVKIIEKDFDVPVDINGIPTGSTSSNYTIKSPAYYSAKHVETDQIPFFNYKDYNDPITGTISEWNMSNTNDTNQDLSRMVDNRVKIPFYATSVPVIYTDDDFLLTDNISFFGGTNITGNNVDLDIFSFSSFIIPNNTEEDNSTVGSGPSLGI